MTGIQALERLHPSLPMLPSHVEREEFEDKRHGTQSLIANLDVATGQLVAPSIGPPREHLVAEQCGIQEELGLKGKSGHLPNMSTRAAFLSDTSHRIRARLHSQTQLLAQPDGDLVLSPCSSLAFPAQLPLCAGVAYPHPGLYCLLQSHVQWGLSTSPTKDLLPVSRLLRYFREAVLVSCYQQV
ncbi:MAG: hypothetical protein AUI01_05020 [Ktedonobacter sp. 13_2_20CM_2_56_8]|nr:MAG: hypothetical protein AUI01_05020 [Ktedonobacter sp. 13_2_20CM_2_56_8]